MRFLFVFLSLVWWARTDLRLRRREVLGRAWAPLPRFVRFVGWWFSKWNYNNIMLHASNIDSSSLLLPGISGGTFNFSRFAEQRVIQETSRHMGLEHARITGYITTGATEANLYALWVAREWAATKRLLHTRWIVPQSAHYSVCKALNILGVLANETHVIHSVSLDKNGTILWEEFRKIFDSLQQESREPVICVLTAMTTEFGLIDPITEFNQYLEVHAFDNVHLHIDAAFSAFVLPYLSRYRNFFGSLKRVNSWSIDYHKVLGGPTASGAVLMVPGLEVYSRVRAAYLRNMFDHTLTGSRKGIDAVMLLALFMSTSRLTLERRTAVAKEKTIRFHADLSKLEFIHPLYEPFANYLIIEITSGTDIRRTEIINALARYAITATSVTIDNIERTFFKIVIRYDTPSRVLSDCIRRLQAIA